MNPVCNRKLPRSLPQRLQRLILLICLNLMIGNEATESVPVISVTAWLMVASIIIIYRHSYLKLQHGSESDKFCGRFMRCLNFLQAAGSFPGLCVVPGPFVILAQICKIFSQEKCHGSVAPHAAVGWVSSQGEMSGEMATQAMPGDPQSSKSNLVAPGSVWSFLTKLCFLRVFHDVLTAFVFAPEFFQTGTPGVDEQLHAFRMWFWLLQVSSSGQLKNEATCCLDEDFSGQTAFHVEQNSQGDFQVADVDSGPLCFQLGLPSPKGSSDILSVGVSAVSSPNLFLQNLRIIVKKEKVGRKETAGADLIYEVQRVLKFSSLYDFVQLTQSGPDGVATSVRSPEAPKSFIFRVFSSDLAECNVFQEYFPIDGCVHKIFKVLGADISGGPDSLCSRAIPHSCGTGWRNFSVFECISGGFSAQPDLPSQDVRSSPKEVIFLKEKLFPSLSAAHPNDTNAGPWLAAKFPPAFLWAFTSSCFCEWDDKATNGRGIFIFGGSCKISSILPQTINSAGPISLWDDGPPFQRRCVSSRGQKRVHEVQTSNSPVRCLCQSISSGDYAGSQLLQAMSRMQSGAFPVLWFINSNHNRLWYFVLVPVASPLQCFRSPLQILAKVKRSPLQFFAKVKFSISSQWFRRPNDMIYVRWMRSILINQERQASYFSPRCGVSDDFLTRANEAEYVWQPLSVNNLNCYIAHFCLSGVLILKECIDVCRALSYCFRCMLEQHSFGIHCTNLQGLHCVKLIRSLLVHQVLFAGPISHVCSEDIYEIAGSLNYANFKRTAVVSSTSMGYSVCNEMKELLTMVVPCAGNYFGQIVFRTRDNVSQFSLRVLIWFHDKYDCIHAISFSSNDGLGFSTDIIASVKFLSDCCYASLSTQNQISIVVDCATNFWHNQVDDTPDPRWLVAIWCEQWRCQRLDANVLNGNLYPNSKVVLIASLMIIFLEGNQKLSLAVCFSAIFLLRFFSCNLHSRIDWRFITHTCHHGVGVISNHNFLWLHALEQTSHQFLELFWYSSCVLIVFLHTLAVYAFSSLDVLQTSVSSNISMPIPLAPIFSSSAIFDVGGQAISIDQVDYRCYCIKQVSFAGFTHGVQAIFTGAQLLCLWTQRDFECFYSQWAKNGISLIYWLFHQQFVLKCWFFALMLSLYVAQLSLSFVCSQMIFIMQHSSKQNATYFISLIDLRLQLFSMCLACNLQAATFNCRVEATQCLTNDGSYAMASKFSGACLLFNNYPCVRKWDDAFFSFAIAEICGFLSIAFDFSIYGDYLQIEGCLYLFLSIIFRIVLQNVQGVFTLFSDKAYLIADNSISEWIFAAVSHVFGKTIMNLLDAKHAEAFQQARLPHSICGMILGHLYNSEKQLYRFLQSCPSLEKLTCSEAIDDEIKSQAKYKLSSLFRSLFGDYVDNFHLFCAYNLSTFDFLERQILITVWVMRNEYSVDLMRDNRFRTCKDAIPKFWDPVLNLDLKCVGGNIFLLAPDDDLSPVIGFNISAKVGCYDANMAKDVQASYAGTFPGSLHEPMTLASTFRVSDGSIFDSCYSALLWAKNDTC